jgi:hypothetical protein
VSGCDVYVDLSLRLKIDQPLSTASVDMFSTYMMMHVMASPAVVALHLPLWMWPDLAETRPTSTRRIRSRSCTRLFVGFPRAVPDRFALG